MTTYDALSISPVPAPGPDATAPELYRGIYGMPMFCTIPTADLDATVRFWTEGLGFFDLFTMPGQLTHLRRWAFQDVLVVAGAEAGEESVLRLSFACVLNELEGIAQRCEALRPGCSSGIRETPWNAVELEVITPEKARVVATAARPLDPSSPQARYLAERGIPPTS